MEFDVFSQERRLAPYAVSSIDEGGQRRVPEPGHPFRSPFQRDRDRVIHSRAFRRLDGKTQVFLSGAGDHYRTRLTHTIEVAALARTIARRLQVNEDLTETIALAHDLGHPPFGHMGESVLNRLLKDHCGGFDHNAQSLRVVDLLEEKYPEYDGLNLCREVRRGLVKHRQKGRAMLDGEPLPPQPGIEAQIADLADDLAYYGHDVDDGLGAGLLDDRTLLDSVTLWRMAREIAADKAAMQDSKRLVSYTVRCLIDMLAGDAIRHSLRQLRDFAPTSPQQVRHHRRRLVGFSPELKRHSLELHDFLYANLYQHQEIMQINQRMGRIVEGLFSFFLDHPEQLGDSSRRRIRKFGRERAIADYIAGMTDSFARQAHRQFCDKSS